MFLQRFRYFNMRFEHSLSGLLCYAKKCDPTRFLLAPTTVGTSETRCGVSNLRGVREGAAGPRDVSRSPARPLAASQRKDALNARLQHLQPAIEQESVSFSVCSSRPKHPPPSGVFKTGERKQISSCCSNTHQDLCSRSSLHRPFCLRLIFASLSFG